MSKEERVKEIRKAIKLLGWIDVGQRIRNPEDRAIFNELGKEFEAIQKDKGDKILKQHQINF